MNTFNALADSININHLTRHSQNKLILRQLKGDDPSLSTLSIRRWHADSHSMPDCYLRSRSDPDEEWLGYFIGNSLTLKTLVLDMRALGDLDNDIKPFCSWLCYNRSIETIKFEWVSDGHIFQELVPFFMFNNQLASIELWNCALGDDGSQMLYQGIASCRASWLQKVVIVDDIGRNSGDTQMVNIILALALQSNLRDLTFRRQGIGGNSCNELATLLRNSTTRLETLDLSHNSIDDESIEFLVPALLGIKLRVLSLAGNRSISILGLRSIAVLINDPYSNLEELCLYSNNIRDDGALVLANALAGNQKLRKLDVRGNAITAKGLEAFCKLVCDTSTINNTFLSNHTLRNSKGIRDTPSNVCSWWYNLRLNSSNLDKKLVAVTKILKHHHHFDMRPFFEWDLKVLPLVIVWLEKANTYDTDFEKRIEERKLDVIHQFVRAMPMLCIEAIKNKKKRNKRKRQKEKKKQLKELRQHASRAC